MGLRLGSARIADSDMIFDSHAHLISDDAVRYPPLPGADLRAPADLERPFTVEHLLKEMDRHGVARAALVQRASIYGYDNSYVCDSAARFPERLGAVCSIDARQPTAPADMEHWTRERGAVGIRLMEPAKGADLSWLDSPAAHDVWSAANERDVPVCVHFFRWNRQQGLVALRNILSQWPRASVVIDHVSNIAGPHDANDFGLDDLLGTVMAFPGVHTKFTTIPLGHYDRDGVDAAPLVTQLVARYGADRIMWGSDITQSAGDYTYMVGLARRATASLTDTQREQVLYGTACAVYRPGK
jgi:L-fuconolactonase